MSGRYPSLTRFYYIAKMFAGALAHIFILSQTYTLYYTKPRVSNTFSSSFQEFLAHILWKNRRTKLDPAALHHVSGQSPMHSLYALLILNTNHRQTVCRSSRSCALSVFCFQHLNDILRLAFAGSDLY